MRKIRFPDRLPDWQNPSEKNTALIPAFILSIIAVLLVSVFRTSEPLPYFNEMRFASEQMHEALRVTAIALKSNSGTINTTLDPMNTGFIGIEFSPLTTTTGNLSAKQTAVNPDFAALLIHWIRQLNLARGEKIVIHASGSFPSLTIASIIAAETCALQPIIISSLGASSFGANLPHWTYADIENVLFKKGIIHHRSRWLTPGGENDNGSSFWPGGMEIAHAAAERNSYQLRIPENLQIAIRDKWEWMNVGGKPKLFINIGGNQTATGASCDHSQLFGLILPGSEIVDNLCDGLIRRSLKSNIPVINLLNIRSLAIENGIEVTPVILPQPGQAKLYLITTYPLWLVILLLSVIISILLISIKRTADRSVSQT